MAGTTITVTVKSTTASAGIGTTTSSTVSALKTAVRNSGKFGSATNSSFMLNYGGAVLSDSKVLSDYGINDGSTITLVSTNVM